jgi:serine beta-lactamase-like protein LACTB, mitochondrial
VRNLPACLRINDLRPKIITLHCAWYLSGSDESYVKLNTMQGRKIGKIVAYSILALVSMIVIGLRIVVWYTEKNEAVTKPSTFPSTVATADPDYRRAIDQARRVLREMVAVCETPSVSISVSMNGKIVWSESVGYSNLESQVTSTPQTRYRINSVTKVFTAALAARLNEQGKLDWHSDIRRYVDFPDKGYVITPLHLASHTSGIRGYRNDLEAVQTKHFKSVQSSLEMFKDDALAFKPGSDFLYSGFGFVLLSAVIEKAGNDEFTRLMEQNVFEPLEMMSSHSGLTHAPSEATFYDHESPYSPDGSTVVSPPNDFSFKLAAGGYFSTADDLVKFGNGHIQSLHTNFLRSSTLNFLFKPQRTPMMGYGLGWMTGVDPNLRNVHFHFGAGSGGTSLLAIYPAQKLSLAILSNLGHARFPIDKIFGIVNAFLYSPAKIIFNCWLVAAALISGIAVYRKIRTRKI